MIRDRQAADEVYDSYIDEARAAVRARDFPSAEHLARQALARDPERAASYNILAVARELQGHHSDAMALLRAGIAVEPTYRPAQDNLARLGSHPREGGILFGDEGMVKHMESRMERHPSVHSTARKASRRAPLLSGELVRVALRESISMLLPQRMVKNPVMFVSELGAVLSTLSGLSATLSANESAAYQFAVSAVLWATVLFANFAEALAEARGKAQTQALRETRKSTAARRRNVDGSLETVASTDLKPGDIAVISVGETIPADGEIIEGVASIDESAITGESAPVVREAGGDRSGVTGGTRVLSDEIVVRVTAETGDSFLDRMIALVEGAKRQKTPNEIALTIMLAGLTLAFLMVTASLLPMAAFFDASIDLSTAIALLVCLIPTTIGGLLAAIGVAGMDRALKSNVLAKSGKAVELAGDIDTVLLDKTGTITQGNRQATDLFTAQGVSPDELARVALLASLADATPEGKSLVALCEKQLGASRELPGGAQPIAFSAQTRLSGVDLPDGRLLRKGAVDAVERWLRKNDGGSLPAALRAKVDDIARNGGTPLVVAEGGNVMGVVALSDVLKAGIKQRFERLRAMGLRIVMVTGDNPLTAAAIAKEAGVDDFIAEATPEDKLAYIRKEQDGGRLVAMMGDGTNDAPALAQADIGVAMNSGTQAAKEAGNMVDLDSDPTKLIEVVEIGKQLLMTRGALTTFSIANDVAKYFAIVPALFIATMPSLAALNIMGLSSPRSAILSAVIFNAIVIPSLIPVALKGVRYRPASADQLLRRNLFVYGLGGLVLPFIGIKGIDLVLSILGVA
jgi:K+-transporting ATPase ATPase B chain